jgi:HK97 gp10 family phage protein
MAKVKLTLEGMERTLKALQNAPEVAKLHASQAISTSTFAIGQRAKALAPRGETGNLRDSIEAQGPKVKGLTGRVGMAAGPAASYWFFVEFGTRFMAARPFFRPAAELERNDFVRRMQDIGPKMERDLAAGRFT